MNKPKKKVKPKRPTVVRSASGSPESRTAVAVTVAWTLSLMSVLSAEGLGLAFRWYTVLVEPVDMLTILSSVMLFVATTAGFVTLCLTPVILRLAKPRPPRFVVQVALVSSALPIFVVLLKYLMHSS